MQQCFEGGDVFWVAPGGFKGDLGESGGATGGIVGRGWIGAAKLLEGGGGCGDSPLFFFGSYIWGAPGGCPLGILGGSRGIWRGYERITLIRWMDATRHLGGEVLGGVPPFLGVLPRFGGARLGGSTSGGLPIFFNPFPEKKIRCWGNTNMRSPKLSGQGSSSRSWRRRYGWWR